MIGNSSIYLKNSLDKTKHNKTFYRTEAVMHWDVEEPDFVECEKVGEDSYQVSRLKRKISNDRPVYLGIAVYQKAKLRILQFIEWIDSLVDQGEPSLRIIATLTGQIRGSLWVCLLEEKGERDVSIIAKAAGISNPKRIYILRKQIKNRTSQ